MALPVSKSVADWPLILCGPILRRVTPTSVAIFVALKEPRRVDLEIYSSPSPGPFDTPIQSRGADTIALGTNLHVCVVEWRGTVPLATNHVYGYDVMTRILSDSTTMRRLGEQTPNLLEEPYKLGFNERLPSFVVPPDLQDLVVVHGSCRKPHGNEKPEAGRDALPLVDELLRTTFATPARRPHFQIFTGDQIYADDVSVALLSTLRATAADLMHWVAEEKFPAPANGTTPLAAADAAFIAGPNRKDYIAKELKLTSSARDAHLMFLGEFYAMYLFAWSDVLWPRDTFAANQPIRLPSAADLLEALRPSVERLGAEGATTYMKGVDEATTRVHTFAETLPRVRRVLANVPTLMMFDDHDVTDDWYLDGKWASDVRASAAGRQLVRNGLAAYAVFQDWGNHPENYDAGTHGAQVLSGLSAAAPGAAPPLATQPDLLDVVLDLRTQRTPLAQRIRWDWHYSQPDVSYQIVALDTRTFRGYGGKTNKDPPALIISDSSKTDAQLVADSVPLGFQLLAHKPADDRVTILLSPAPVIGHPTAEFGQRFAPMLPQPTVAELEAKLAQCQADLAEEQQKSPSSIPPKEFLRQQKIGHLQFQIEQSLPPQIAAAKSAQRAEAEYDSEAWSSNRAAFEDLLKRLAGFGRVVILSGDVHYAFSAHVAYFLTGSQVAARFVQFCSSSLRNQDTQTMLLADRGFSAIPTRVGWFGFDRDLTAFAAELRAGVDTRILSADTNDRQTRTMYATLYFIAELNDRFKRPAVIPAMGYVDKALRTKVQNLVRDSNDMRDLTDWSYVVEYLRDERAGTSRAQDPTAVSAALGANPGLAHRNRMLVDSGRSVVGKNNVGVVRFEASNVGGAINRVTHTLLWSVTVGPPATATHFTLYTQHESKLSRPGYEELPWVTP